MAEVRLHRKIVQVVSGLKWTVSVNSLRLANEARLASRTRLIETIRPLSGTPPNLETVRAFVALSTDAWRIQDPPDWEAAQELAQAAVDMAGELDSLVDRSLAYGALGNVLDGRSRLRDHLQVAERRLAICRLPEFSDTREQIEALRALGSALMNVGEYAEALPHLDEAVALAIRVRATDQIVNSLGIQAQCLFRLDRWDEVLAVEDRWRELERRHTREQVGPTCFFVALSASVHARRGELDRAGSYATESFDFMVSVSGQLEHWQRNQFY
jgi:tetratricopeptide (TPR) repeat protein